MFPGCDGRVERTRSQSRTAGDERAIGFAQGVLVILDGGKGLRAAVRKAFHDRALVHRCQWHKRENVVRYLAKSEQASWRQRLQCAYNCPTYTEALGALETLHRELEDRNQSAAGSLAASGKLTKPPIHGATVVFIDRIVPYIMPP